jgi:putative SOS response-associated peptidase YedK
MCCRYLLLRDDLRDLLAQLGMPDEDGDVACFADKYNIAPCAKIPVVRTRSAREPRVNPGRKRERECVSLIWNFAPEPELVPTPALVPAPAPAPARGARFARPADAIRRSGLFNARAESLREKPAFREAARLRRCLSPTSGFYEWARAGRARLPWLFQLRDAEPFFMAGIWEAGADADADTCAIITTESNTLMQPVHNRMPAIITAADAAAWLDDEDGDGECARLLLSPFAAERMTARRVSMFVNNARNEGVACMASTEEDATGDGVDGTLPLF